MSTYAVKTSSTAELLQIDVILLAADRRLRQMMTKLLSWLEEKRRAASALTVLEAMSDRELRDIGLTRFDMQHVAAGGLPRVADVFSNQ